MGTAIAGKDGDIAIAGYTVDLKEWTLDIESDIEDTSAFGDSWKTNMGTLLGWSGSASGFAAAADLSPTGTSVACTFEDGSGTWTGNAIVGKVGLKAAVDGLIEVSFDLTGDGAISYA